HSNGVISMPRLGRRASRSMAVTTRANSPISSARGTISGKAEPLIMSASDQNSRSFCAKFIDAPLWEESATGCGEPAPALCPATRLPCLPHPSLRSHSKRTPSGRDREGKNSGGKANWRFDPGRLVRPVASEQLHLPHEAAGVGRQPHGDSSGLASEPLHLPHQAEGVGRHSPGNSFTPSRPDEPAGGAETAGDEDEAGGDLLGPQATGPR